MNNLHLYNIRILNSYVDYLEKKYPHINITQVLEYTGISRFELEDMGYWYTQEQADRFNEIVFKLTGNKNISREAGRYSVITKSYSTIRQFILGFVTPYTAFSSIERIAPKLTRGGTIKYRKIGSHRAEMICIPVKGVSEKPYQCQNRMGMFEAIPMILMENLPSVEHPECIHKGDEWCRYVISWEKSRSFIWKRTRNYFLLSSIIVIIFLLSIFPFSYSILFLSLSALLITGLSYYAERLKNRELINTTEAQGNAADQLLEEINIRYNNALLVQEIGHAISSKLNIGELLEFVMQVLQRRTDFDRGIIMLADKDKTQLVFTAGYGYDSENEDYLRSTEFHLDNPTSRGIFVKTFRDKTPFLVSDINIITEELSRRSTEFVETMGTKSFISVPIVFKEEALGVLAVDNIQTKRALTKSDMNLLSGIAQQIGISINNARSFSRLQASEEKYRELVEHANSIIMRINTEGKITFFNEFAQNFFGYSDDELLGRDAISTIMAVDFPYQNKLNRMLKEIGADPGKYLNIQTENIVRNKEKAWIAWTNKPVFDNEGRLKEILCVGNDITEVRRVEEKIEHLNELLLTIRSIDQLITHEKDRNLLIENICGKLILTRGHVNSWIVLFDKKGKFERGFESGFEGDFHIMLEKFKDELQLPCCRKALSQHDTVVISIPGLICNDCGFNNRYNKTGRMINRLEYNGKVYGLMSVEVESDFISDEEEPLLLKEVADEIAFALYSIELEEERKSLQEQLFQSAKLSAVGQLAAGVAHEFNNVLSGILGHAQISLMEDSISNIKESLQDIESATRRGSGLVMRLSEFARPKEPEFEVQDIVGVIQEIIKLQKKQIQVENIEVRVECGEYSHVLFDRGQIGQVFLNLLINAIHAMKPAGRGKIIISVKDKDNHQEIRFSDTGTGMSKETMKKIFDPFFSTKGAWAKDNLGITGTGLGLSVSHAIVKQHKGTISVESEEGKGTTFIIRLPIPPDNVLKKAKRKKEKIDIDDEKTKNLKILVVDDEEEMINLMKLIFQKTGFNNFITEKSGNKAVQAFKEYSPDVVFLDMLMPGMDGEQVLEKLKSINRAVPVVFMSGKLDLEEHEYKNKGAYDFIKKPFNVNSIFDILNKVAGEKEEDGTPA